MSARETGSAAEFLPPGRALGALGDLEKAAAGCRGCSLHAAATQTVFGEGLERATFVLVGEQPGDKEDLEGKPFVGPAGRLLDDALAAAGIERADAYVTNVVKHFKFEMRGKRRIHKKPNLSEIRACTPWLEAELDAVKPKALVCLGATAAQALIGPSFKVSVSAGSWSSLRGRPSLPRPCTRRPSCAPGTTASVRRPSTSSSPISHAWAGKWPSCSAWRLSGWRRSPSSRPAPCPRG